MTQPHYIDREAQPVSNPYKFEAEIAWLQEAARYFASRPTGGEDAAHWSNVYNAENANKIASRLEALSSRPAMETVAWLIPGIEHDMVVADRSVAEEARSRGFEVQALAVIPTEGLGSSQLESENKS